jgi:small subunit ribosomal protein S7
MSRRRRAIKREILPDPKYNSSLVSRLVDVVMKRGKKTVAEKIVYGAFDEIVSKMWNARYRTDTPC